MIEVIGFDADDTLWHNEVLYHQAKEELGQMLAGYRDPEEVKAWLDRTEVANIKYYGYGIKSFTLSMIETASQVTEGKVSAKEINEIIATAKRMLTAPVDLVDGVKATLETLSSNYTCSWKDISKGAFKPHPAHCSSPLHYWSYNRLTSFIF